MLQLSAAEVKKALTPAACLPLMAAVLRDIETGDARQLLRTATPMGHGILGYMPAELQRYFGAKLITVFHENSKQGLPSHQGSVLLFDKQNGTLLAMVDGGAVTEVRTGAVSALATDALARKDAKTLALLGAGKQAESHLVALRLVRQFAAARIWDIDFERAKAFAAAHSDETLQVIPCSTAQQAVEGADVICTLTPAHTPVLEGAWVKPGAHVNAVGACAAGDRECDTSLVSKAQIFCDNEQSLFAEGGDFLIPLKEGAFDNSHLKGTLGAVLLGRIPGRQREQDITFFEALGLAAEDVSCAAFLYENSRTTKS